MRFFSTVVGVIVLIFSSYLGATAWSEFIPGAARQYIPEVVLDATVPLEVPSLVGIQTKAGSYGVRNIVNQEIDFETHTGTLTMSHVTAKKSLEVTGILNASTCDFYSALSVFGPLTLDGDENVIRGAVLVRGLFWSSGMRFEQQVNVEGSLFATQSKFNGPLIVSGTKIELNKCGIADLIVHDSQQSPATVIMHKSTLIHTITFTSGNGLVITDDSSIMQDRIVGGHIKVLGA